MPSLPVENPYIQENNAFAFISPQKQINKSSRAGLATESKPKGACHLYASLILVRSDEENGYSAPNNSISKACTVNMCENEDSS